MAPIVKTGMTVAIVVFAAAHGYGVEFVVGLSAMISLHMLWASRLRPELILYLADLPNNLLYWICVGVPLGLLIRTLALSMILLPVYILSP